MEDAGLQMDYKCEYSKSGRAKCKKCAEMIPKDVLRLARMVPSKHHDGPEPLWFHYDCFFQRYGRALKGTEAVAGFEHIRYEDQKRLEASIEEAQSGGKGTKRALAQMEDEFTVEYAKSSRAKCKLCEQTIAIRKVRIGKKDYESGDAQQFGPLFRWFHLDCFVSSRDELDFVWSGEQLPGFDQLEAEDQRALKKQLKPVKEETTSPSKVAKVEKKEEEGEEAVKAEPVDDTAAAKEESALKKQSDELFDFIKNLKALRRGELTFLLECNDIGDIGGDSNVRLEVLADGLTFGRPEDCPVCGGYLRFNLSHYECHGNVNEWEKCSFETEAPERRPFLVPELLQERYDFLKNYEGKTGTRIFSTKMKANLAERKRQQLAQLVTVKAEGDTEEQGGASASSSSTPLDGFLVAVHGSKQAEVVEKLAQYGGKVASAKMVGKTAAFLVTTAKNFTTGKGKAVVELAAECRLHQVPVVSEAVFGLLHLGVAQAILQSAVDLWGLTEEELAKRLIDLNIKAKLKETFTGAGNAKKLKQGVNKMISKGGAVVDEESGLADRAHILKVGDSFYSAVLNCVDVAQNKNSFYKLQLLEADHGQESRYWVFRSWGRIGCGGKGTKAEYYSKVEAIAAFRKLYEEKTGGNRWEDRKSFRKVPGAYFPVDVDYGEMDAKLDVAVSTSKLPDPVKYLISLIFDVARMKQTMLEFELDLDKMPLGKLSKAQLLAACSTLKEIAGLLEGAAAAAGPSTSSASSSSSAQLKKMQAATNKFYSLVPHNFGTQRPPLIKSAEEIAAKMAMIESLMDIELAYDIMKQEGEEQGPGGSGSQPAVDPIDAHYQKLNAAIEPLDPESEEFALIQKYLRNTHAATHSDYTLEIRHVFKVERAGEAERFAPHSTNKNRMLLWHGSRLTNFAGILSQGLRIAPPEAPVCGYMFGKGVYFADSVSKSANYCATSAANDEGLMLLSEVAVGKSQEHKDAHYVTSLPKKYSSVKGVGTTAPDPSEMYVMEDGVKVPMGKMVRQLTDTPSSLLYNEYIVYSEEQIKLRYLLNVKFNYN